MSREFPSGWPRNGMQDPFSGHTYFLLVLNRSGVLAIFRRPPWAGPAHSPPFCENFKSQE